MSDWKRVFAIIFTGQFLSTISSMVVGYSVIFWLSIETGSAGILAYATIAALLPQMVLGLFSGVYIDRWNRKKTMIFADLFIAACTLAIAILFYTSEVKNSYIYIYWLYVRPGWHSMFLHFRLRSLCLHPRTS